MNDYSRDYNVHNPMFHSLLELICYFMQNVIVVIDIHLHTLNPPDNVIIFVFSGYIYILKNMRRKIVFYIYPILTISVSLPVFLKFCVFL